MKRTTKRKNRNDFFKDLRTFQEPHNYPGGSSKQMLKQVTPPQTKAVGPTSQYGTAPTSDSRKYRAQVKPSGHQSSRIIRTPADQAQFNHRKLRDSYHLVRTQ